MVWTSAAAPPKVAVSSRETASSCGESAHGGEKFRQAIVQLCGPQNTASGRDGTATSAEPHQIEIG